MAYTFPEEARSNFWNIVATVGGANLRVRLYRNSVIVSAGTVLSGIQEANYDSYAAKSSSIWSAPAADTNGDIFILSPTFVFQRPNGVTPNLIYGHYLTWDDGVNPTLLLAIEAFTTPAPMYTATDEIPLRVKLNLRSLVA